jgi:hypothetical protein
MERDLGRLLIGMFARAGAETPPSRSEFIATKNVGARRFPSDAGAVPFYYEPNEYDRTSIVPGLVVVVVAGLVSPPLVMLFVAGHQHTQAP